MPQLCPFASAARNLEKNCSQAGPMHDGRAGDKSPAKNISFPGNDGEELIRYEKMKRMVPVSIDESFPNIRPISIIRRNK